jgi:hypothetical protein
MALARTRLALPVALVALAAAGLAMPSGAGAQSATVTCPATFEVLHDDHVGRLSLPAGPYTITVRGRLSCASASDLFRQFLEDWDGRLPRPWVIDVPTATFNRGANGTIGFSVKRASNHGGGGGGGHHPANGGSCPAFFRVLHNDRIGSLRVPAGNYRITILAVGRISCASASRLFAQFLQDFDGRLPRPWILDTQTGTFLRGSAHVGFRVKRASGKPVNPSGGGNHPSDGTLCRATFRVLHNDRIGSLRLPRGPYRVTLLRGPGLTCAGASQMFTRFLSSPAGRLPRPWVLNAKSATFTRGRGSKTGFRVKPVNQVRSSR